MNNRQKISSLVLVTALLAAPFLFALKNYKIIDPERKVGLLTESSKPYENFKKDVAKTESYAVYENHGWDYAKKGNYPNAIEEYKKAIKVIEGAPDEYLRTDVSKEYKDSVNRELKVSAQIFSRYGLIDALEKDEQYEDALKNVDWLMQNQQIKGKEEFLKAKLDGMKQKILQKMSTSLK